MKQKIEKLFMNALWNLKLKWREHEAKGRFVSFRVESSPGLVIDFPEESSYYEFAFCPEDKLQEFKESEQPFKCIPPYIISGDGTDIEKLDLAEQVFKRPEIKITDHE